MNKLKELLIIVGIVFIAMYSTAYAEKNNTVEKSLKIYPTTSDQLWSIFSGTTLELLTKKSENKYTFLSLNADHNSSVLGSNQEVKSSSAITDYQKEKLFYLQIPVSGNPFE